ncbi:Zinc cluster transcription factor acuM [Penicillium cataractarum]|uniref:Zinc cluster transcription factor acuM n=1 Tax=Penicillium cataractarum TaxID=2100454 RepID=A0A9W9V263_9EURO|nr:Zinc cluster transcription factor acuM [Penicillium cataractarum]KAJ5363431.1 Zinc cluster transcription factor acuM [Penicillium cataractarum]
MTEKSASGSGAMSDKNAAAAKSKDAGKDARAKDSPAASAVKSETSGTGSHSSPKKRRKVNHGKVPFVRYATGIVGRKALRGLVRMAIDKLILLTSDAYSQPVSIVDVRDQEHSAADEEGSSNNELTNVQGMRASVDLPDSAGQQILPDGTIGIAPSSVQPPSIASSGQGIDNPQQLMAYNDWLGGQNQFQDMHSLHPSYMFNAPEVTNEYNLLGDFPSNSLLDDGALFQDQSMQGIYSDPSLMNSMNTVGVANGLPPPAQLPPAAQSQEPQGDSILRPTSTVGNDKARETYYMTAADPSGSDPPEERMNKLLKAKYDAGLLKPFNYVKGYARLNQYMEKNMHQASRQKILRQLDKFRPKFRERMQSLTDIELILVEMWFERSLMEYDRVFASMAIPACCWRRTGEIFRGNNEMAQLIDVPIESLRDGKLAIHEFFVEDQLVSYWEKFGAIAFDNTQKAMLTSCTLKSPSNPTGEGIPCCFSFTIRRDNHNIPSLIVGNFLPTQRVHK